MKTKLIAVTILMLLAATPLIYARGGPGFGGAHFGGFRGGHRFSGGGNRGFYGGGHRFYGGGHRFYGGGNRFYTGGGQHYGMGHGYYGYRRDWGGHYRRHGDWAGHHRRHRGNYYYYRYADDWWPWLDGYYATESYPYDSYVSYNDSDAGYYGRRPRTYHRRVDRARHYTSSRVHQP